MLAQRLPEPPLTNTDTAPSRLQLAGLREHLGQGQHAQVLEMARELLERWPTDRELRLIEGSALRHQLKIDQALAVLDPLCASEPRFSLAHQERGLCHVANKDAPAAIAALLRAVNLNPALPRSWRMLEGLYRMTGEHAHAATAAAHVNTLQGLPPPVVSATALFADGALDEAEAQIRQFLRQSGDHPEAMRLLARIGIAHEVYDDAQTLLEGVLALAPEYAAARYEYAQVLSLRHKPAEAEAALAPLLAANAANRDYRTLASTIAVGLGQQDKAIQLYRALLVELPDPDMVPEEEHAGLAIARADLHLWLGHALKTLGDVPEAIASYRAATTTRPDFGDAWWSLANLKTYRFDDAEIAAMQCALGDPATAAIDQIHLGFALGKGFEDRGEPERAWEHYRAANAAKRTASRYRPEIFETNTAEQRRVCTRQFFVDRAGWGAKAPDPIFIVGLPRAGSTLIEQILASHSMVEGTQELPDIQRIVLELQGREPDHDHPHYPEALTALSADHCRALGERYLAETRVFRADRPYFIDKMPNNFRHLGLIRLILPNATIIDARREPMACCFSNLKQLFAQGQEFAYAIEDIARYYRTYLDLMRHWDASLGANGVLRVVHEDLIDDLEGNVRRLLDHCGLPFEPACLAFHQTRRAVRTPSSEQVRQPIFRDGLDQWRRFEPWLDPLKDALGGALATWRD